MKRRCLKYRKFARKPSENTLDRKNAARERYGVWDRRKGFAHFYIEQAMRFLTHFEHSKTRTGKPLGKTTMRSVLATLRSYGQISRNEQRKLTKGNTSAQETIFNAGNAQYALTGCTMARIEKSSPERPFGMTGGHALVYLQTSHS